MKKKRLIWYTVKDYVVVQTFWLLQQECEKKAWKLIFTLMYGMMIESMYVDLILVALSVFPALQCL